MTCSLRLANGLDRPYTKFNPGPSRIASHNPANQQSVSSDVLLFNEGSAQEADYEFSPSRSTFPRRETPTARARNAGNILSTKSLSTRPAGLHFLPRESADTTASNPVMVVKPSPSFTKRPRPQRRLSYDWSAPSARLSANWPLSAASTSSLGTSFYTPDP